MRDILAERILQNIRNELFEIFPLLDTAFSMLIPRALQEEGDAFLATDGQYLFYRPGALIRTYAQHPERVRRAFMHLHLHCLLLHPFLADQGRREAWDPACDSRVEALLGAEIIRGRISGRVFGEQEVFDDHGFWYASETEEDIRETWRRIASGAGLYGSGERGSSRGNGRFKPEGLEESGSDYHRFLRAFTVPKEELEINDSDFDLLFYTLGFRHYKNMPLIEPLEYKEVWKLSELVIAIDTSASCSKETVQRFLGETWAILSQRENFFEKMKVYIIQCDCFIQEVKCIRSGEEWMDYIRYMEIQGRSGTDFRPVFETVERLRRERELRDLKALLYFTDGDGIYPEEAPDYETAFVFLKESPLTEQVPGWARVLIVGDEV